MKYTNERDSHFFLAGWNGARRNVVASAHFQNVSKTAPASCLHQIQEPAPVLAAPMQCVECQSCGSAFDVDGYMAGYIDGKGHCLNCSGIDHSVPKAAPAAVAAPDERAAFEDHFHKQWPGANREQFQRDKNNPDRYENLYYQLLWMGWEANAGRTTVLLDALSDLEHKVSLAGISDDVERQRVSASLMKARAALSAKGSA